MENLISRVKLICDDLLDQGEIGPQIALANAAGASKSVVNQWLAGKIKSIDINYALAIEKALGYNHIWLMIGKGEKKVGGDVESSPDSKAANYHANANLHEALARTLPKTDSPVNADVLSAIGFISDEEARVLSLFRMATPRGRKMIEVAANTVHKQGLIAVADDEAQGRLAGAGDRNRL